MNAATDQASLLGAHQMQAGHQNETVRNWRCTECGVTAAHWFNAQSRYETRRWIDWRALDGRTWYTEPGDGSEPPSCPLPGVEAVCPWRFDAQLYAGAKGDVQLATALRTWCEKHQMAVADCPEPGPYCPGMPHHDLTGDGTRTHRGCTGREKSCQCRCPACCGDTPDMYGYDGDY